MFPKINEYNSLYWKIKIIILTKNYNLFIAYKNSYVYLF